MKAVLIFIFFFYSLFIFFFFNMYFLETKQPLIVLHSQALMLCPTQKKVE